MPVYEYACRACTQPFSQFYRSQRAAAAGAPLCPHCGATDAGRTISPFIKHQTEQTKIDNLDPTFERQIDAAMRYDKARDPLNRVNLNPDG